MRTPVEKIQRDISYRSPEPHVNYTPHRHYRLLAKSRDCFPVWRNGIMDDVRKPKKEHATRNSTEIQLLDKLINISGANSSTVLANSTWRCKSFYQYEHRMPAFGISISPTLRPILNKVESFPDR